MSSLTEILVTCDSNNSLWTCCIQDPHTGTNLMRYRGGGTAEAKTLSFIGNDYLAAVEKTKPVLHVWPLNSQETVKGMQFILPGKARTLAISSDGSYIIAGIDEKVYLWQVASGKLLTIINRHYQNVVLLKFTPDGKYFISAAEDGMVMVWALTTVAAHPEIGLMTQSLAGQHDPVYIFSDHSLPVTDLCISKTGIHGRLSTVSSDRSCKVYDLSSGEMLLNLVYDLPLTSITMDILEHNVFIGTAEGSIYQFSLINPPRNRDLLVNTETNGPAFISHTKAVTCLSVSFHGKTLMSGGNDNLVILWDIPSKQPLRTTQYKGPITNAFFTKNYPPIFKRDFTPNLILHSLDRTLEKETDDETELEILVNRKIEYWPEYKEAILNEILEKTVTVQNEKIENNHKVHGLELKLQKDLEGLKTINANLYAFSIQKTLESIPVIKKSKKKNKKIF